jgi:hypothetical protein
MGGGALAGACLLVEVEAWGTSLALGQGRAGGAAGVAQNADLAAGVVAPRAAVEAPLLVEQFGHGAGLAVRDCGAGTAKVGGGSVAKSAAPGGGALVLAAGTACGTAVLHWVVPVIGHAGLAQDQSRAGCTFRFAGLAKFVLSVKFGRAGAQAGVVVQEFAGDTLVAGCQRGACEAEVGGDPTAQSTAPGSGALVLAAGTTCGATT